MKSYPEWLHVFSWFCLALCMANAAFIVIDFFRGHRQKMWIMHLVWPITAMYFGPIAVWMYLRTQPVSLKKSRQSTDDTKEEMKKSSPRGSRLACPSSIVAQAARWATFSARLDYL